METGAGEVRMGEAERRRSKEGGRKTKRRKEKEEEIEEGENYRSKESSGGVGNMG